MGRQMILAVLLLLFAPAPAASQALHNPTDAPIAQQTSSRALRTMLAQAVQSGNSLDAVAAARRYAAVGGSLSQNGRQMLRPLMDADAFAAWSAALDANAAPVENSVIALRFDGPRLVEAIAPNLARRRWFASAVADGAIWQGDSAGRYRMLAATRGHGGVFGLAYDSLRNRLWAAHSQVDQAPVGSGFAGVIAYRAGHGRVLARVAMPDAAARAGDIAIDSRGNLFVADPVNGAVYHVDASSFAIRLLANSVDMGSAQGIAVDEARQRLFVSDYGRGIAIIPLDGGPMRWLESDVPVMLDGADGLFLYGGALIAIQNGAIPHRIARWTLSGDGRRVVAAQVLERAHSDWDEPTQGVIIGTALYYVGNSQWRRFGDGGVASTENPPVLTEIRRLLLTPSPVPMR